MTATPAPQTSERIGLALVLLIVFGLPLSLIGYRWGIEPLRYRDAQVVSIVGRLPERGGWSPETVTVEVGRPVRLRLTSEDVVHGFAIGKLGVHAGWVYPGQVKEVVFTPERPGRYTFYCTTWCAAGHWRMRGTIEVVDPANPSAAVEEPPMTDWQAAGVDIDAPHLAPVFPSQRPSARRGEMLWREADLPSPEQIFPRLDLTRSSPAEVFLQLRGGQIPGVSVTDLTDEELWHVVAFLWREYPTPGDPELGGQLYQENCAACHGENGAGDGPGREVLTHDPLAGGDHGPQAPADFTDAEAMAGANSLIFYGKIVRGGMGTGMPYWGTIFTEQELWSLIQYLWTFLFDLS